MLLNRKIIIISYNNNIYNIQMSHFPLNKYNKRTTRFITNLIVFLKFLE